MPKKPGSKLKNSRNVSRGRLLKSSFLFLFALVLSGCAGYRLGPTNGMPAGSRTLQVNLFQNETWEPRLSDPLATSIRRMVQKDGTFLLATRNDGDIVVDGAITEFNRSGLSFDPRDVLTVRDYELVITAHFTATERATGKVLISSAATGRTTIRSGADLPSSERQAAPLLAEDLARKIVDALVDGSW
jgi:outer membrane lipopolysaccharide assembly protein LptE/RlpB